MYGHHLIQKNNVRTVVANALLVLAAGTSMSFAQNTCSARCPSGSMSETFDCTSNYVPMCLRGGATDVPSGPSPRQQEQQQLELERQQELRHQQEEAEREHNANEAEQKGLDASDRGDWKEAADRFIEALGYAPDSEEIRANLDRANTALAAEDTAAEISVLRQRIEYAIAVSKIEAARHRVESEIAVRQLTTMSENFRIQRRMAREAAAIGSDRGTTLYPALLQPIPTNSAPARVLAQSQPKIKELDEEIRHAQDTLRRLIVANSQNEAQRLEWTKESEEATVHAQSLAVNLVIDLVGARVDELTKISDNERANVLNHLMSRAEEDGQKNSIHVAYKMLIERKKYLERIGSMVRNSGKGYDKIVAIRELSVGATKSTLENVWEAMGQFKQWDEFAGPSKDLVDAAATIYQQAVSLESLDVIQSNQENTLQASRILHRYILRLVAERKFAKVQSSGENH